MKIKSISRARRFSGVAESPDEFAKKTPPELFHLALQDFADLVRTKFALGGLGEPEDQLRAPIETLFEAFGRIIHREIVLTGEPHLKERLGKPDFAAHDNKQTIGYVEAKAPGKGAETSSYKGHDLEQWQRFRSVPNILYTDGNDWALYRSGEREGSIVRFERDVRRDGGAAVSSENAGLLFQIFTGFCSWTPIVPKKPKNLAEFLAPYCRLIRSEVEEALDNSRSPLQILKKEIKALLFPEATDRQFADAYAQTVIFALLLARLEGADILDLSDAYRGLESRHLLLSRSLQFLTDPQARQEISGSLGLTQRVIQEVLPETLKGDSGGEDPWLFFYEFFLAKYDPKLRREWGVYYTPVEVVRAQVALIDEILTRDLGRTMGFVEPGIVTLDPALGTGTYLLAIMDHTLKRVEREEGAGAVRGGARSLANNLHGFEWMVGPYAVAQLRYSRALLAKGASLPPSGIGIYLTNTLESPHTHPPAPPMFHKPIAEEHKRALKLKDAEHVLVCLGNPPYGRHEAAQEANHSVTGGWVRYGDKSHPGILDDFIEPARKAGFGIHLKNLYNQYVYFIRWALWKVFEHETAVGPGVVSFITASSYLEGDAFAGLREHMRRVCDRIDIIDLGGEGRGARKDENVFAIQTPVAIFIAWRKERKSEERPAVVRYARLSGTREEKLKILSTIGKSDDLKWNKVSSDWQATFRPSESSRFFAWPVISDVFPWQQSGVEVKRSWPIGPEIEVLKRRWDALVHGQDKAALFKETRDRKVFKAYPPLQGAGPDLVPIAQVREAHMLDPVRYAFRSFDRQYVIPDNRVGDYFRPSLWNIHSDRQIYFASSLALPICAGPALAVASAIPDRHYFCNRGGKDIIPLYRDIHADKPNIAPGLLEKLSAEFRKHMGPEELAGYIYAVLAQPEYTTRFSRELESREIRVPMTKNPVLFFQMAEFGKALIWLHTYGERMTGESRPKGKIPIGEAKCLKAVSDDEEHYPNEFDYDEDEEVLRVGDGIFKPVKREVFHFEVSGFHVVRSWLGYRMRNRSGRKSSPLDEISPRSWTREFTRELLELLWALERTTQGYLKQKKLLEEILAGPLFLAEEYAAVPGASRKAPRVPDRDTWI
jgi:hypothetical protein